MDAYGNSDSYAFPYSHVVIVNMYLVLPFHSKVISHHVFGIHRPYHILFAIPLS